MSGTFNVPGFHQIMGHVWVEGSIECSTTNIGISPNYGAHVDGSSEGGMWNKVPTRYKESSLANPCAYLETKRQIKNNQTFFTA